MQYNITQYPLVIDPVSAAIELHVEPVGSAAERAGWRQFVRVHPAGENDLPFTPTPGRAHFFGDNSTLPTSNLLLVYDNRGGVQCLLARNEAGRWEYFAIPEEFSGYVVQPSLRLVFENHTTCREAAGLIDNLVAAVRRDDHDDVLDAATRLAKVLGDRPDYVISHVLNKAQ